MNVNKTTKNMKFGFSFMRKVFETDGQEAKGQDMGEAVNVENTAFMSDRDTFNVLF